MWQIIICYIFINIVHTGKMSNLSTVVHFRILVYVCVSQCSEIIINSRLTAEVTCAYR